MQRGWRGNYSLLLQYPYASEAVAEWGCCGIGVLWGCKMGASYVRRRRRWSLHLSQLDLALVVLHLLLASATFVSSTINYYYASDVDALQHIWAEWNSSTGQDLSSNLAGWSSTQVYPCQSLSSIENATIPNWRGVYCLKSNNSGVPNPESYEISIVTLSLANASIVGTLSPYIGNLTDMTTLELTGNPELTGNLPESLGYMWLNTLDVHDNGFSGPLQPGLINLWNLLQLDLSGNQFSGGYPLYQTSQMHYLQVLNIAHNNFFGQIPADAFRNKTELQKLDISDNNFNGSLPNMTYMLNYLNYLDVSGNDFEGLLPDLRMFESLRHVNFGRNKLKGTARLQDILNTTNPYAPLEFVDLSDNSLTGSVTTWDASSLGTIQELYLDNNTLSGTLDISQMHALGLLQMSTDNSTEKLRVLSLTNNNIQHVIYNPFVVANVTTVFKLQGNPYCDNYDSGDDGQRCYCTQVCFVTPPKTDSHKIIIIAVVCSVISVALLLLVLGGALLYKSRRYKQYLQLQFKQKFDEFDVKPTIFSYNELRAATRDFSEDMKLGQGGYGAVYKGVLPNGNVVAVKQLYVKQQGTSLDEFSNEVVLITGMKHRNLVNLKGCCLRESQRLLVYEYVDNYDVEQILLGSRRQAVNWPMRLKICLGIARGLHYLHALAMPRIIHRDIKASNVLLDKNLEPKIADFGLALLFPDEQSHIMTVHVAGTKGYLAPEYAALGQLSDKVDVYSFGVLCLEIISGRKHIVETAPVEKIYLSKWAWVLHEENRLLEIVDPQLHIADEELRDLQRVLMLCLLCIQNAPEKRPTMARVVSILQSDTESQIVVLGDDESAPAYRSARSSRSKSLDYQNSGLESVLEEGGSSSAGNGYQNGESHKPRASHPDLSIAMELSNIQAR